MSTVKIKINPYKDLNVISIDGRALSPYSELSNFTKSPFLEWAYEFFETAESEVNDDFDLVVIAEDLETEMLRDLGNNFAACMNYEAEKFSFGERSETRIEKAEMLSEKYSIDHTDCVEKLKIRSDVAVDIDDFAELSDREEAFLWIIGRGMDIPERRADDKVRIIIHESDERKLIYSEGVYIWDIPENQINDIVNMVISRFSVMPAVSMIADRIRQRVGKPEAHDARTLQMLSEVDAFVFVEDIPKLEAGERFRPGYDIFPKEETSLKINMVTSNPGVLKVDGDELIAVASGEATVEFFREEEPIPFDSRQVSVFRDNAVKKIVIDVPDTELGIGDICVVQAILTPDDADNIDGLKWSVADPSVVQISEKGELKALKAGKTQVIAEVGDLRESAEIIVLPDVTDVYLSVDSEPFSSDVSIDCYHGRGPDVRVRVEPENCFDPGYEWSSSDERVAVISKRDSGEEFIETRQVRADCVLTCTARRGTGVATCKVHVKSTFDDQEHQHTFLSITAVCAVISMICSIFEVAVISCIAAVVTLVLGIVAIRKNRKDVFWSVLLMAAALALALMGLW